MFRKFSLLIVIAFFSITMCYTQVNEESIIKSFSSRKTNPIDIDINESTSGVSISIKNESYFRYLVKVTYTSVVNLRAAPGQVRNFVLPYGNHNVCKVASVDNTQPSDLFVNITSQICPSNYENGDYTYLYPLGKGKNLKHYLHKESQTIYLNMFHMHKHDTVFAMRKGIIVNTPKDEERSDRVGAVGSFEVLHDDGTVMIYYGTGRYFENLKRGAMVFPGQPIGIIVEDDEILSVSLFFIQPNASLSSMPINYPVDCYSQLAKTANQSDCFITRPLDLIMQEMSKSEKKKYLSGKLF